MPSYSKGIGSDGIEYNIYVYPGDKEKVVITFVNDYNETWGAEGATENAEFKCSSCGVIYTKKNGVWIDTFNRPVAWTSRCVYCNGTKFINKYPDLDALSRAFTRMGVEKTLGTKLGRGTITSFKNGNNEILLVRIDSQKNVSRIQDIKRAFTGGAVPVEPQFRPSQSLPKPPKPPKTILGLGSEGRKRLRVLFDSTLDGLGITSSNSLKIRVEELICQLDSKTRFTERHEATNKSVIDLTKWIEKNVYFSKQ